MCFFYGKYGHSEATCHIRRINDEEDKEASERKEAEASNISIDRKTEERLDAAYGPWMVARRSRRRATAVKGNSENGVAHNGNMEGGSDHDAKIGRGTNAKLRLSDAGAKTKGSRFAALDDRTDMEADNEESNEGEKSTDHAIEAGTMVSSVDLGKETNNESNQEPEMEAQPTAHLNVSHKDLTVNLRSFTKNGPTFAKKTVSPSSDGPKKEKEKNLKDITNKLVIQPVNLKQSKTGLKQNSGLMAVEKGVKRNNQMWVNEDVIELIAPQAQSANPSRPSDLPARGQMGTRPPDPQDPSHLSAASRNPNPNLGSHGDGGSMDRIRAGTASSLRVMMFECKRFLKRMITRKRTTPQTLHDAEGGEFDLLELSWSEFYGVFERDER